MTTVDLGKPLGHVHHHHIQALRDNGITTAVLLAGQNTWHTSPHDITTIRNAITAAQHQGYFGKPYQQTSV